MRTSRVSQDAARALRSASLRANAKLNEPTTPKSNSRSLQSFQYGHDGDNSNTAIKDEDTTPIKHETIPTRLTDPGVESIGNTSVRTSKKRKYNELTPMRENAGRRLSGKHSIGKSSPTVKETVSLKEEAITPTKPLPRKPRRAPAKRIVSPSGHVKIDAPPNWEEIYNLTKEMRSRVIAPVDTVGCERLADVQATPKDRRFQTLVALMLSSQTKDTVTAVAMKRLKEELPGSLTVQSVLLASPETFNELIGKVGFHNTKTKNIVAAAKILARDYDSDIPSTIDGLISLPGVGPKMAYLTMSGAWGRTEGIGVDVHVHRITNLWGWHQTKNPEETRALLEAWLPKEKWHEINTLLVGLGQTICTPVARKCGDCVLGQRGLCPGAVREKVRKAKVEKTIEKAEGGETKKQHIEIEVVEDGNFHLDKDVENDIPSIDIEDFGPQPRRRSGRLKRL